jgi:hypothetical protein
MKPEMLTSELLRNPHQSLHGTKVVLDGVLCIGSPGYFVEFSEEKIKLPILEHGIRDRLLNAVPCYLGGLYLYRDQARLVVTLETTDGEAAIGSIDSGELSRDDETYFF